MKEVKINNSIEKVVNINLTSKKIVQHRFIKLH